MIIGVPKEIKKDEYRVAMIPAGIRSLVRSGHQVIVEKGAGEGSGFSDREYREEGARIIPTAKDVWAKADLIVKVKEPLAVEYKLIKPDQIVFTYFHFASSRELTEAMVKSGAVCVAYETIELEDRSLPLLAPMSAVAGRMATQEGAEMLEKTHGGRGVLLGGVPGVEPATVVVLGGGVVGTGAAKIAAGMGARVYVLDKNQQRLEYLSDVMPANVTVLMANELTIRQKVQEADLVVCAALVAGGKAPILITRDMLKTMKRGSVIVDVSIDQGGNCETSRPTTHSDPVYEVDGVWHYCVANMPGAVPRTSTIALRNATFPYVKALANLGLLEAMKRYPSLVKGVNIYKGKITYENVAAAFGMKYTPLEEALAADKEKPDETVKRKRGR
ncbi:MAG: alanine dehydrogenase [Candidatus Sumerlaeia bacterium]